MGQKQPVPGKNGFQFTLKKFFVAMDPVFLGQTGFTYYEPIVVTHVYSSKKYKTGYKTTPPV
jgi:hypothetical protein